MGPFAGTYLDGKVTIKTSDNRKVYVLDAAGSRKKELAASWKDGSLEFRISPDDQTMFYEITSTK